MSTRRRYVLAALIAVLLAALVAAVVVSYGDPEQTAAPDVETPGASGPTCRSDGSSGTEAPDAVYHDPIGDAQAGHGDIRTVQVSEDSDVTTIESVVPNLRETDAVVASLDTDCDGRDDFVLRVWNDGSTYLSQLSEEGIPITDVPASTTRRGATYTTRFETHEINRATAFRFRMRVDTEVYEGHSDLAPDDASDPWLYGGARA